MLNEDFGIGSQTFQLNANTENAVSQTQIKMSHAALSLSSFFSISRLDCTYHAHSHIRNHGYPKEKAKNKNKLKKV